ncbi:MAG: OmpA family protein [Smithella sp.]|jgi:outer membrane protein OmpA-like peptidoglycan-associated protein
MKTIINTLAGLSLILVLAGCGAKSMVVLIPDPDGNVGQLVVANEGGQQVLNKTNQSVQVTDRKTAPGKVTTLSDEEIRATFSDALAAQPLPPARFILYFLQDSDELTDESKAVLPQIFQTIQKRGSTDIVISGHTDTVGTNEYNYQLSLDRAQITSEILVANGAVPANITVTSHGEGNPLVKTADEVAEPRNRRVEIVIK